MDVQSSVMESLRQSHPGISDPLTQKYAAAGRIRAPPPPSLQHLPFDNHSVMIQESDATGIASQNQEVLLETFPIGTACRWQLLGLSAAAWKAHVPDDDHKKKSAKSIQDIFRSPRDYFECGISDLNEPIKRGAGDQFDDNELFFSLGIFPAVLTDKASKRIFVRPYACCYASFQPSAISMLHLPKWMPVRVPALNTAAPHTFFNLDMSLSTDLDFKKSVQSAINLCRPKEGSWVWFMPMDVSSSDKGYDVIAFRAMQMSNPLLDPQQMSDKTKFESCGTYFQIAGASLGMGCIAAFTGMPRICYTGFVRRLNTDFAPTSRRQSVNGKGVINKQIADNQMTGENRAYLAHILSDTGRQYSGSENIQGLNSGDLTPSTLLGHGQNSHAMQIRVVKGNDIVEKVDMLSYKVAWAIGTGFPLCIPYISDMDKPLSAVLSNEAFQKKQFRHKGIIFSLSLSPNAYSMVQAEGGTRYDEVGCPVLIATTVTQAAILGAYAFRYWHRIDPADRQYQFNKQVREMLNNEHTQLLTMDDRKLYNKSSMRSSLYRPKAAPRKKATPNKKRTPSRDADSPPISRHGSSSRTRSDMPSRRSSTTSRRKSRTPVRQKKKKSYISQWQRNDRKSRFGLIDRSGRKAYGSAGKYRRASSSRSGRSSTRSRSTTRSRSSYSAAGSSSKGSSKSNSTKRRKVDKMIESHRSASQAGDGPSSDTESVASSVVTTDPIVVINETLADLSPQEVNEVKEQVVQEIGPPPTRSTGSSSTWKKWAKRAALATVALVGTTGAGLAAYKHAKKVHDRRRDRAFAQTRKEPLAGFDAPDMTQSAVPTVHSRSFSSRDFKLSDPVMTESASPRPFTGLGAHVDELSRPMWERALPFEPDYRYPVGSRDLRPQSEISFGSAGKMGPKHASKKRTRKPVIAPPQIVIVPQPPQKRKEKTWGEWLKSNLLPIVASTAVLSAGVVAGTVGYNKYKHATDKMNTAAESFTANMKKLEEASENLLKEQIRTATNNQTLAALIHALSVQLTEIERAYTERKVEVRSVPNAPDSAQALAKMLEAATLQVHNFKKECAETLGRMVEHVKQISSDQMVLFTELNAGELAKITLIYNQLDNHLKLMIRDASNLPLLITEGTNATQKVANNFIPMTDRLHALEKGMDMTTKQITDVVSTIDKSGQLQLQWLKEIKETNQAATAAVQLQIEANKAQLTTQSETMTQVLAITEKNSKVTESAKKQLGSIHAATDKAVKKAEEKNNQLAIVMNQHHTELVDNFARMSTWAAGQNVVQLNWKDAITRIKENSDNLRTHLWPALETIANQQKNLNDAQEDHTMKFIEFRNGMVSGMNNADFPEMQKFITNLDRWMREDRQRMDPIFRRIQEMWDQQQKIEHRPPMMMIKPPEKRGRGGGEEEEHVVSTPRLTSAGKFNGRKKHTPVVETPIVDEPIRTLSSDVQPTKKSWAQRWDDLHPVKRMIIGGMMGHFLHKGLTAGYDYATNKKTPQDPRTHTKERWDTTQQVGGMYESAGSWSLAKKLGLGALGLGTTLGLGALGLGARHIAQTPAVNDQIRRILEAKLYQRHKRRGYHAGGFWDTIKKHASKAVSLVGSAAKKLYDKADNITIGANFMPREKNWGEKANSFVDKGFAKFGMAGDYDGVRHRGLRRMNRVRGPKAEAGAIWDSIKKGAGIGLGLLGTAATAIGAKKLYDNRDMITIGSNYMPREKNWGEKANTLLDRGFAKFGMAAQYDGTAPQTFTRQPGMLGGARNMNAASGSRWDVIPDLQSFQNFLLPYLSAPPPTAPPTANAGAVWDKVKSSAGSVSNFAKRHGPKIALGLGAAGLGYLGAKKYGHRLGDLSAGSNALSNLSHGVGMAVRSGRETGSHALGNLSKRAGSAASSLRSSASSAASSLRSRMSGDTATGTTTATTKTSAPSSTTATPKKKEKDTWWGRSKKTTPPVVAPSLPLSATPPVGNLMNTANPGPNKMGWKTELALNTGKSLLSGAASVGSSVANRMVNSPQGQYMLDQYQARALDKIQNELDAMEENEGPPPTDDDEASGLDDDEDEPEPIAVPDYFHSYKSSLPDVDTSRDRWWDAGEAAAKAGARFGRKRGPKRILKKQGRRAPTPKKKITFKSAPVPGRKRGRPRKIVRAATPGPQRSRSR
jgi:hypothetical protein